MSAVRSPPCLRLGEPSSTLRHRPAQALALAPPSFEAQIWQWPFNTLNPANTNMYMFTVGQTLPEPGKRALRAAAAEKNTEVARAAIAVETVRARNGAAASAVRLAVHETYVRAEAAQDEPLGEDDLRQVTTDGSVLRLRPKLMTVGVTLTALLPIMWSTEIGSDVMKPMAGPIIGGMVTSTVHVLIITPVIFFIVKRRALRRGKLRRSTMTSAPS